MEECPKCLGVKTIKQPKKKKGFKYIDCDLCEAKGVVHPVLHQDFIKSNQVFNDDLIGDKYVFYL